MDRESNETIRVVRSAMQDDLDHRYSMRAIAAAIGGGTNAKRRRLGCGEAKQSSATIWRNARDAHGGSSVRYC